MGNKLGRRRQVVDEKYTRPQGLYQHKDVDQKKLRKLILDSKLAPCYPGDDEFSVNLEECPICYLYYPSLNRSLCCMKGICTECFLQMKPPHSTRPTQCPFCKTSNYAVEYRGVRTVDEIGKEQIEEQRVIEAKIRMRQQELHDEEERMQIRQGRSSSSRIMTSDEVEYQDISSSLDNAVPSSNSPAQVDEITPSQDLSPVPGVRYPSHREGEFELDLEDIMIMEAIWLSIQISSDMAKSRTFHPSPKSCSCHDLLGSHDHFGELEHSTSRNLVCHTIPSAAPISEDHLVSLGVTPGESSPSGGLACAIAALAERQHMDEGNSISNVSGTVPAYMLPQASGQSYADERAAEGYPPESWIELSPDSGRAVPREGGEWAGDHGSEVAEAGTSYASSDAAVDVGATLALDEGVGDVFQPPMVGPMPPESFEEQMMLAMAVSLAEARARTSSQGLAWH